MLFTFEKINIFKTIGRIAKDANIELATLVLVDFAQLFAASNKHLANLLKEDQWIFHATIAYLR